MAKSNRNKENDQPMFFSAFNYKLIGLSILLIFGGFTAMYLENKVEGVISLYISPIVIMAGYVIVLFAILKHDRGNEENTGQSA
ncbi:hypothetical protein [Balneola vulgaris]|jgi:hypothetical protein|uniref:hypothetical protein n=1 Tax=Balneola vulgaris TaxID=287535 RepID=UPI00037DF703|nr:hypothetical protein [Balneola vulgaris]